MSVTQSPYSGLSRAQLSYDYLHTNSTTHEFLFGALAELVDNARDATATKISIYTVKDETSRGGFMMCFLDDGEGMDPAEAADIITFGKSTKKSIDSQLIGMYGNGLKSGSMRIGNDLIVFSKKGCTMTCVFLSRTFHEQENIEEIIVPMPSFDVLTKKPLGKTTRERDKHAVEMSIITRYSPFKSGDQFLKEFDRIEGNSGSLVCIFNMKLLDSGEPELDTKTDPYDILLTNPEGGDYDTDEGLMPERKSFRAYTSLLYVDPRMKIYIQGKKVRTKRLANCLYKPRLYKYSSGRFKTRSENEVKKSSDEAKIAENRAKEAESKARNLEQKYGNHGRKEQRAELRRAQTLAGESRKEAQLRKQVAERKQRSLRDPKTLNFIFGMNIGNRNQDGMFVYNCSRLIKMYQKVGPQADGGVFCSGVVGIVDVPYLVLEPTHNKQDFADAKEYRHLQKAMGEHMVQYWKDVGIAQQGVTKFWEGFGYISPNWKDKPSQDSKYIRKRAMQLQVTLQCDLCLKWRMLPFSSNNIGKDFPDDWICSMNPDTTHNRCSHAEQKLNIPEGQLRKEIKSREQKEKDLAEEIKKKQDQLNKLQKSKQPPPTSKNSEPEDDDDDDDDEAEPAEDEPDDDEEEEATPAPAKTRQSHPVRSSRTSSARSFVHEPPQRAAATSTKSSHKVKAPLRRPAVKRKPSRTSESEDDRNSVGPDDDDDDEDEEEEEEEPPPKKRQTPKSSSKPLRAPATPSTPRRSTPSRQSVKTEDEDSEAEEKSPSRSRPAVSKVKKEEMTRVDSEEDNDPTPSTDVAMPEPDQGITVTSGDDARTSDIGTRVEAKVQEKWYNGTVVQINRKGDKWKIKFDRYPKDKYDKWFDHSGPDVKVIKSNSQSAAESQSPASVSSHEQANETPSSSTPAATGSNAQFNEEIANGYRTCLRYFLPPQWVMDKEAVSTLSVQELANFPLDDFFDHYEKGLRKLVSSFQLEAQAKQQEAEQAKNKLSHVRRMIAKLLKSINEEFDIDPESDSDQVDELLAACVKQALQQQSQ